MRATLRSRREHCHAALLERLAPVLRRAKMRPALLRRAAASKVACAACQVRKLLSRIRRRQRLAACCPAACLRRVRYPRPHGAHDVVISPCVWPHRVEVSLAPVLQRAKPRPTFFAAPQRPKLPRRVPTSHAFLPILRRQRLAARPAALPHVFSAPSARGVTVRCCARRCDIAVRLATSRCSRVSLPSSGAQRRGSRCCAAPRRPKLVRLPRRHCVLVRATL